MNKLGVSGAALLVIIAGFSLTGCKSVCSKEQKAGLPVIICQPLDVGVTSNHVAQFEVRAVGKDLRYQWYLNNDPVGKGAEGAQTSHLTIPKVGANELGSYWCQINSTDPIWGTETQTRTRSADLSFAAASSTNIPPTTVPPPTGNPGNNPCGPGNSYCGYSIVNNGGVGFTVPPAPPTITTCCITLTSSTVGILPNTSYDFLRTAGFFDRVCASNGTNSTKCFPVQNGKTYVFTVYFKTGNCPPPGTITLTGTYF